LTLEEIREAIKGSKKLPKCVAVYDKLFKLIKDGEFDEAGKLPTEPELAKIMEVSRMTLRQAFTRRWSNKKLSWKGKLYNSATKSLWKGTRSSQAPCLFSIGFSC